MRRIPIKALSVMMACSIALPLAACKKHDHESGSGRHRSGNKIYEATPWFDAHVFETGRDLNVAEETNFVRKTIAGADEKYIVTMSAGRYKAASGKEGGIVAGDDYGFLEIIDRESGEPVSTFDVKSDTPAGSSISTATLHNGIITVYGTVSDPGKMTTKKFKTDYDSRTGEKLGSYDISDLDGDVYLANEYLINGYEIKTSENYGSSRLSVNVSIFSEDGDCLHIELEDPVLDYYSIPTLLQLKENTVIVPVETAGEERFYEIDLNSFDVHLMDQEEYDWLDLEGISSSYCGSDGYAYYVDEIGVRRIDTENESVDVVFDFNNCGINRALLGSSKLIYCDEESFVFASSISADNTDDVLGEDKYTIYDFSRVSENPNAGKTVLELYIDNGDIDRNTAEAIIRFNENNSEYFIEVSDLYNAKRRSGGDSSELNAIREKAAVSKQLAEDLVDGIGPDILINTSGMEVLNNSNYLLNLSSHFKDLDSQKYFKNIIDAAKNDGKLYHVPITFSLSGIQTDAKYAGQSGDGFTYEEYEEFLRNTLNGEDIIPADQAMYFARLFSNMREKFIVNGRADFTSPEFERLAEFIQNCVRNDRNNLGSGFTTLSGAQMLEGPDVDIKNKAAKFNLCYGIHGYLDNARELGGSSVILGMPSSDGRGPIVKPFLSVAVSLRTIDTDACMEFVDLLMSDEIQKNYADGDCCVVNRNALREAGKRTLDYLSARYSSSKNGTVSSDFSAMLSEQNISDLEDNILRCRSLRRDDIAIELVLIEEITYFFNGQKELEEVRAAAEKRVQKIIDERR